MLWLDLMEVFNICLVLICLCLFLRQDLTMSLWLTLNSQRASCLCLLVLGPDFSRNIFSNKILWRNPICLKKKKSSFSDRGVRNVGNWGAWNTDVQRMLPPFFLLRPPHPLVLLSLPALEFPEPLETYSRAKLEKHRLLFPLETALQTQMCFAVAHNELHLLVCRGEIIYSLFLSQMSSSAVRTGWLF